MVMSTAFDYDITDISQAYAAARTRSDERALVWAAYLRREGQPVDEMIDAFLFTKHKSQAR
jgi:hypothetical protein